MCGIAGIVNSPLSVAELHMIGQKMVQQLNHRGPDANGIKIINHHQSGNILLAHTRLKIIDLSNNAAQPMSSYDGSLWIVFNGEIYNFQELRDELISHGFIFKSKSDTEVILAAYRHWGTGCFERFIGMWALGLWDQTKNRFILSRDRLGIKPLYYAFDGKSLIFGSEPKVIVEQVPSSRKLNLKSLSDYFSYRYVLGGSSFFSGIESVEAGTHIIFQDQKIIKQRFWQLPVVKEKTDPGEKRAREELEELMYTAVEYRMIADVPVGSFLSGGLDSSVLVALMAKLHKEPIKTFTIGFQEEGFNEFDYAREVAKFCQTDHKEILLDANTYLESLHTMLMVKDAPLAVPNEIALHKLSKILKKDITVVLSGEGADELFGGYGRIFRSAFDFQRLSGLKTHTISKELKGNLYQKYSDLEFGNEIDHFLSQYSYFLFDEKMKILNPMVMDTLGDDPHNRRFFSKLWGRLDGMDLHEKYIWIFQRVHLEGLLGRLDSATMSASVEGRVPFVDHRLIENINALPLDYKLRWVSKKWERQARNLNSDQISEEADITKFILRTQYQDRLPESVSQRRKIGFPVPLTKWLSGPLHEYASAKLLDTNAKTKDIFNQQAIKSILLNDGDKQAGLKIWMMLNVEEWMNIYNVNV